MSEKENNPTDRVSIIAFSGDLDKMLAAFVIATGAAASGMRVDMFFTFWGIAAMRKKGPGAVKKSLMDRLFGWMLPRDASKLALSQMNMAGMGAVMMKKVMKNKKVASLPELIDIAGDLGVNMHVCEMSMNVLGFSREELRDEIQDVVGVASYLKDASASHVTLFI